MNKFHCCFSRIFAAFLSLKDRYSVSLRLSENTKTAPKNKATKNGTFIFSKMSEDTKSCKYMYVFFIKR